MRHRSPLPAQLARRPFLVSEALALGVSASRLREGDLHRPHRGVRVPADLPPTVALACAAALLLLPPGSAVCGTTAVSLLGLPTPWRSRGAPAPDEAAEPVCAAVPRGVPRPRVEGVDVRRAGLHPRARLLVRRGVPVLHPADVWAERCAVLAVDDAVALGDAARRTTDPADLAAAVERLPSRELRRRAQQVLGRVRYRVDSPLETRLRLLLLAAGVPEPCCGDAVPAGDHPVAWPDLSWPALRVAVEVDGAHHAERRQWLRDLGRRRVLEDLGWRLVVLSGEDVLVRPAVAVALVVAALEAAAREQGVTHLQQW